MSGEEVEICSGYEVHFKRRHLPDHPSGGTQWPSNNDDGYENRQIKVDRFCHDTHRREYTCRQIRPQENGNCTMIPRTKTGKKIKGETYTPISAHAQAKITDVTSYRKIETDEEVLPGYYSWWAIHKTDNPPPPPVDITVSDLFKDQPTSRYGSKRISTTSLHLLQSYQDGFVNKGGQYPLLQFRNGGTLRYKHEICYVVIACAKDHFTGTDDDYPIIPANIQYDDSDNGRITSVGEWSVTIRNGVTTKRKDKRQSIPYWDHYVFAFHYPAEDYRLVLPSAHVDVENVEHNFCIKREDQGGFLVCPDRPG